MSQKVEVSFTASSIRHLLMSDISTTIGNNLTRVVRILNVFLVGGRPAHETLKQTLSQKT